MLLGEHLGFTARKRESDGSWSPSDAARARSVAEASKAKQLYEARLQPKFAAGAARRDALYGTLGAAGTSLSRDDPAYREILERYER